MWAAFEACARVRGFAAAAACGEAFGSKRVATARRDGFAAAAACGEAFGSKRVAAGASGVDAASAGAVMRQLQPSACCSASILIARDRARGCNSYFLNVSGYCQA